MYILIGNGGKIEEETLVVFFLGVCCNQCEAIISEDSLITLAETSPSKYFSKW